MLWPSIRRWNTQRRRIGKLMASTWCITWVCRASSSTLPSKMPAMPSAVRPCSAQKLLGDMVASQSTTWPMTANSMASYMASRAEVAVSKPIQPRMPCVQAHIKAKNPLGGTWGSALG